MKKFVKYIFNFCLQITKWSPLEWIWECKNKVIFFLCDSVKYCTSLNISWSVFYFEREAKKNKVSGNYQILWSDCFPYCLETSFMKKIGHIFIFPTTWPKQKTFFDAKQKHSSHILRITMIIAANDSFVWYNSMIWFL